MTADPTTSQDGPAAETASEAEAPLDVAVEVDAPASNGDRVAQLEAALAKAEQDKKDNWDKFLRAAADLENHRRRSKRDMDDARAEAKTRILKEMLPVVDNLERAVQHAEEAISNRSPDDSRAGADLNAIVEGVRLVLRQFMSAFERGDVTAVEAAGQPFDPNLHEAISQIETDQQPPGTVVNMLQRGYKLGDRLLRPALVVVAKAPSSPSDGEGQG